MTLTIRMSRMCLGNIYSCVLHCSVQCQFRELELADPDSVRCDLRDPPRAADGVRGDAALHPPQTVPQGDGELHRVVRLPRRNGHSLYKGDSLIPWVTLFNIF